MPRSAAWVIQPSSLSSNCRIAPVGMVPSYRPTTATGESTSVIPSGMARTVSTIGTGSDGGIPPPKGGLGSGGGDPPNSRVPVGGGMVERAVLGASTPSSGPPPTADRPLS
jgi:hypothetical protein